MFYKTSCSWKFHIIHKRKPVSKSLFSKKRLSLYCKIFKKTYFEEHPRTAALYERLIWQNIFISQFYFYNQIFQWKNLLLEFLPTGNIFFPQFFIVSLWIPCHKSVNSLTFCSSFTMLFINIFGENITFFFWISKNSLIEFRSLFNWPVPLSMNISPQKGLFGKYSQFLQYSYDALN